MNRKAISGIILTLLLVSMLTLAFNIQPTRSEPTTIIVPDDYLTIQEAIDRAIPGDTVFVRAGVYYEHLIVDKNICITGENKNLTLIDGSGPDFSFAFLISADNVQIKGFTLRCTSKWGYGILLRYSSNCVVEGNIITSDTKYGIWAASSDNNTISNNLVYSFERGVTLNGCRYNIIDNNFVCNSSFGIIFDVWRTENNVICGNTILTNDYGMAFYSPAPAPTPQANTIYHNNFINNRIQTFFSQPFDNIWDDDYPSGGNYWSDYEDKYPNAKELDGSGIWDTPYVIDRNNQDNYPLMKPWSPTEVPPVEDTEAYIEYVNGTIQDLPDEIFDRPGEDVPDVKNDFSDLLDNALENIDEGNYELAIEKLNMIKTKIYEEMVESAERQEIISLIDNLIEYLETLL